MARTMKTTRQPTTVRRPELNDEGDLVTDYSYLAGLVELIDTGNAADARKWHKAIPVGSLHDADARAIHRGIGHVLATDSPSVPAIPAAIREGSEKTGRRVVEIYSRVSKRTIGADAGAYMWGLPERVREIEERHAREEGLELAERLRQAVEDRSTGPEVFAGIRRYLEDVEALTLRRPGRRDEVKLVTMDTIEAKPMAWLWPQRLVSNGLNVVTGLMGQTKGFFMVDVAAKITRGSRWPDGTGHAPKGSVVWVGNEDDPATVLRPRLDAAGADVSKVHYLTGVSTGTDDDCRPVSIGTDLAKIAAAVDRLPDCRMIVLDPVSEFMDADENASKEIRRELMPLVKLAGSRGIALVVVCHQNKKLQLSTLQKIAGGGAFGQIARAVLSFREDPDCQEEDDLRRRRLMVVAKMSGGRKNVGQGYRLVTRDGHAVPGIEWIPGEIAIDADDSVNFRPSGGRDHQAKTGDAVDFLRDLLAPGPIKALDVHAAMDGAGFKRRQIDAAVSTLAVVKRQSSDRSWTWALPAGDAFEGFEEFAPFAPRD